MHIAIRNARKLFDGVPALDGVTLSVPPGTRVALAGPNGSGKSTVVRAVMGLVRCDGVRLDGRDAFTERGELAPRIAYVPQTAPFISACVRDVVDVVASLRGLDAGVIRRIADRLRLPMRDIDDRPVRALSGGMKQKLLIALALAAPASLFVLDEPTASLDAAAREAFFEVFAERAAGATMLLSTHRPDEVRRLAERVVTLENGRVTADESAADWLRRDEDGRGGVQSPVREEAFA